MISTEIEEKVSQKEHITQQYDLIIYNDDFNTFDHVIECLVEICNHTPIQAEQCTLIIHYKGKCQVKKGEFDKLNIMRKQLVDKGLSAVVE